MFCKEVLIKKLRKMGIVIDERISTQLVNEYFYSKEGSISKETSIEILEKTLQHPYFLTGLLSVMDHIVALEYNNIECLR